MAADAMHQLVDETLQFCAAFQRWVDQAAGGGLAYPKLRLLESLRLTGAETMSTAGDRLGLSARNMTNLVDALEREGLVFRRTHPRDRRAVLVELTEHGLRVATGYFELRTVAIGSLFDDLDPTDQQSMLAMLETLRHGMRIRGVRA